MRIPQFRILPRCVIENWSRFPEPFTSPGGREVAATKEQTEGEKNDRRQVS